MEHVKNDKEITNDEQKEVERAVKVVGGNLGSRRKLVTGVKMLEQPHQPRSWDLSQDLVPDSKDKISNGG